MNRPDSFDDVTDARARLDEALQAACLRGAFLRALRSTLVSAATAGALGLAGCAAHDDTAESNDGGTPIALTKAGFDLRTSCAMDKGWSLIHGFDLEQPVDFVADESFNGVLSQKGTSCLDAPEGSRCFEDFKQPFDGRHLRTTEGETVRLWNVDAVGELFGAIDRPEEALWLADAHGYVVPCTSNVQKHATSITITNAKRGEFSCEPIWEGKIRIDEDGVIAELEGVDMQQGCSVGRRPEGLCSTHRPGTRSRLGEHFASMAHMEAASVPAFSAIVRELESYGAPRGLVRQAQRAQRDEILHAKLASRLARRFGAQASLPRVRAMPVRDLRAFALDNAIEGCVHETYAALEASHQALHAQDPTVRRVMQRIARDETRHAALSWQLAAYCDARLTKTQRVQVRERQQRAVDALGKRLAAPIDARLAQVAGLPTASAARALFGRIANELWG